MSGNWLFGAGANTRKNKKAALNFSHNKKLWEDCENRLLCGQKNPPATDMRYGKYTLGYNGCELIAVCNVMLLLGNPQPLWKIVLEAELNNMFYFFKNGVFGSDPKKLRRFFSAYGLSFSYHKNQADFLSATSNGESLCGIVSFWNNKRSEHPINFFGGGLHTVAFSFDKSEKIFKAYNVNSHDKSPVAFEKIDDLWSDRRFIVGYVFKI